MSQKFKLPINNKTSFKVTQIASPIGRSPDQKATLVGLGLNKMHRSRIVPDNASVRGMLSKVKHLVNVEII